MAEKLCTLRTKGGGGAKYTETSLWTNSAPTSSFTSQTVTLSESMNNFKYLKIKYAFSTSLYADANCNEIVIPVADFKKSLSAATGNALIVVGGSSSTTRYTRFVFYPSDTGVQFGHSVQFQTSSTNDNACIPLEILGLNELDHGKNFDETTLWTNNAPTSAFGQQTVTLSDDFSNYDYIKINFRNNVSDATASEALISASALAQTNDIFPNLTIRGRYSNTPYVRQVYRASTTQITIVTAYQMAGTGANNNAAIPTSIVGCKFR